MNRCEVVFNLLIIKENEMFKDYALDLLHGVQNFTCIQRDYLHTVITVENKQVLGNIIDVFKQRTGTVLPHTDGQKTLGREVRTRCYNTTMHVSLGCHDRVCLLWTTWQMSRLK